MRCYSCQQSTRVIAGVTVQQACSLMWETGLVLRRHTGVMVKRAPWTVPETLAAKSCVYQTALN